MYLWKFCHQSSFKTTPTHVCASTLSHHYTQNYKDNLKSECTITKLKNKSCTDCRWSREISTKTSSKPIIILSDWQHLPVNFRTNVKVSERSIWEESETRRFRPKKILFGMQMGPEAFYINKVLDFFNFCFDNVQYKLIMRGRNRWSDPKDFKNTYLIHVWNNTKTKGKATLTTQNSNYRTPF